MKSRDFIGLQRLKPLKRYGNGSTCGTPEGRRYGGRSRALTQAKRLKACPDEADRCRPKGRRYGEEKPCAGASKTPEACPDASKRLKAC